MVQVSSDALAPLVEGAVAAEEPVAGLGVDDGDEAGLHAAR
jgi:hypothetical protein